MARGAIVKRKSGSYAIRYFDPSGRRHYETIGPTRAEAERALAQRLNELHTGNWHQPSQETLTDYVQRWLARRDPNRTPTSSDGRIARTRLAHSTHREYQRSLDLHVLPHLGHRPLASLQPAD